MAKEICISSTPHETRLAIVEDDQLTEVYYERENEYTLAGSIYQGRVTRVLPGMQSAFVDVGLERDAFLYVTDFLEEQEDSAEFERVPAQNRLEDGEQPSRETREGRAPSSVPPAGPREDARALAPAEDSADGTRRWRGRRGRRRGVRPRGGQEPEDLGRAIPAEVEDRGNDLPTIQAVSAPQSLPGESLSKYGGQGMLEESPRATVAPDPERRAGVLFSKPSTLIEEPLQWDGSSLLPGESLSRYRDAPGIPTGSPASALAGDEPASRTPEDLSGGDSSPAGSPLAEHLPQPAPEADPVSREDAEFEPRERSASYRVDPSAPSEFRFFSAVEPEPSPELPDGGAEPAAPEMDGLPQIRQPDEPALSSRRELPVFDGLDEDEEDDFEDDAMGAGDGIPAMGLVEEEEVSEEEEYDFPPLSAHTEDHDLDDLEEETLDQQTSVGSEIGEMVREAHLNQRIRGDDAPVPSGSEEADGESSDLPGEVDLEEETSAAAGRPARREGQDQRRGGRGARFDNRRRHNGRRQTAQTSELPVISDLLQQGQEILVQIAKEPIAKKGARITSHIALPGRFLVFMPTVNHVGVSRKISSEEERHRLKRILISEKGTAAGGFIVRTAAEGAGEEDLRADIRFLISLWTEIKQRSEAVKAPALIYHDLNLVERILRDQASNDFSTIWVDNEAEYERIVRFLNRFQPSLVRRVKLYTKETPLFEQFGIQDEIGKALKSKVWLKSGGSIVINQTEALVAIDINTGKYVGKTTRLEDTILKTNLDAIPEIVRQIRLRDLGGIIVIDFIDMDERRNRHKVMQALEEALKADRAPSKVLQFNDFGLVAITRKRVKQSLERTLCQQCSVCAGTGMVKSPVTVCNEIYIEMRKMQRHLERQEVVLRAHPEVVKTLKAGNARWLMELEEMTGKTIIVRSDPALHPEQFDVH